MSRNFELLRRVAKKVTTLDSLNTADDKGTRVGVLEYVPSGETLTLCEVYRCNMAILYKRESARLMLTARPVA